MERDATVGVGIIPTDDPFTSVFLGTEKGWNMLPDITTIIKLSFLFLGWCFVPRTGLYWNNGYNGTFK